MKKQTTKSNSSCNFHIMPPLVTDDDITALFNGLTQIIKQKVELDVKSEILNANLNLENVVKQLNAKTAECNRLKNEILHLRQELESIKNTQI